MIYNNIHQLYNDLLRIYNYDFIISKNVLDQDCIFLKHNNCKIEIKLGNFSFGNYEQYISLCIVFNESGSCSPFKGFDELVKQLNKYVFTKKKIGQLSIFDLE